jgi:branched-chain amino acid transport system ATP-binding protein
MSARVDDVSTPSVALECIDLAAGFRSTTVVRGFSVSLQRGRILALLGPNGAGKTTILATLAGLLARKAGSVLVDGTVMPNGKPAAANRAGVVLVPDNRALFTALTTRENLQVARKAGHQTVDDMMDLFPMLRARLGTAVGALSGGEQQMLAVARGIIQGPRVLLIDEMSTGLAPKIVEGLLPIVRRIADETGAAVILVDQYVELALSIADDAMVMVHGDVRLRGEASDVAAAPSVLEAAYMGAGPELPNDAGDADASGRNEAGLPGSGQ